eukprot:5641273-Amphidinium_carterae.2
MGPVRPKEPEVKHKAMPKRRVGTQKHGLDKPCASTATLQPPRVPPPPQDHLHADRSRCLRLSQLYFVKLRRCKKNAMINE